MYGVIILVLMFEQYTTDFYDITAYTDTVYAVVFEGLKFCGFHFKLVEREILILEKKHGLRKQCIQFDDQRKINHEIRLAFCEI